MARLCVIGAGRWGRFHVATLAQLGALGGVVEKDAAIRSGLSQNYPDTQLFSDLTPDLFEQFDGFVVATPAATHCSIAEQILQRKKPVLVEKPLCLTSAEARKLAELARQNGTALMVGHLLLFHPAVRKIKELLDAEKIGRLQYLYSNRLNLGTVRTEENILWSFAPHDISVFDHFIGARPEEVVCRGGAFLQPGVHDTTMTVLRYPKNIVGHVFVSWLHPYKEHRLVLVGSKGMLTFEDSSSEKKILFFEKGIDWVQGNPIPRDGPTEEIAYERTLPLTEELKYFIAHLREREIVTCGPASAIAVLEVLERATESLESRDARVHADTSSKPYFVHETAIIDEPVTIGPKSSVWHFAHVRTGARIGSGCNIGQNVYIGADVHIGDSCKIQNNVSVYEGVRLDDHVFCGPSMVFTNVKDPRSKYPKAGRHQFLSTHVKEGATLGANCTIVCGTTIGRHAFVAAGAVITKDVPDYALMCGVPARRAGWVCECGEKLGTDPAVCSRCRRTYELRDGVLHPCAST